MAAVTVVSGSEIKTQIGGASLVMIQGTTAANGEDGVTYKTGLKKVLGAVASTNTAGKDTSLTVTWSGETVTVDAAAGATGDSALFSLFVWGKR